MINTKKILIGVATVSVIILGSFSMLVFAAPSAINSGSFDKGTDPGVSTTVYHGEFNMENWSVDSGNIDYVGTYWKTANQSRSIDLNGLKAGSISQSFQTTKGEVYAVTFNLSGNPDSVSNKSDSYWSPSKKELIVSVNNLQSKVFDYDINTKKNSLSNMKWEDRSYSFTATGTNTRLTFGSSILGAFGPVINNVVVEKALMSKEKN